MAKKKPIRSGKTGQKFLRRVEDREQKKFVFLAPEVPDVTRNIYRSGQSSRGASRYRFKQIFQFEINFIGF
jgi:hypothetical protein